MSDFLRYGFDKLPDDRPAVVAVGSFDGVHSGHCVLLERLKAMAKRYKKPLIVVEYRDHFLAIDRIVRSLPRGLGRGTFIWEATSPQWGKLFDEQGAATAALDDYNR